MTDVQSAAVGGAVIGSLFATFGVMSIIIVILFIVAWWKIFEKAGIAGWKSIVPFYNEYLLYRISGMSGWWFLVTLLPTFFSAFCSTVDASGKTLVNTSSPFYILMLISALGTFILYVVQTIRLAEGFKKGTGFKVASVFFPNITSLILAFGKAKYDKKFLHD